MKTTRIDRIPAACVRLVAGARLLTVFFLMGWAAAGHAIAAAPSWPDPVSEETFSPGPGLGNLHYFSLPEQNSDNVTSVLIVMHGHSRDAGNTLSAAVSAERTAGARVPIIAPLFQVSAAHRSHCQSPGLPAALPQDAVWNCHSWLDGGMDSRNRINAFQAMDSLLIHLKQRWPALDRVTLAGFSAGGQFVQHYIGFAHPPQGVRMRYVVADPGSWLYFDMRPVDPNCPDSNQWKYGMEKAPRWLSGDVITARNRYREADITYLEGSEDRGKGPGRFYGILDKSCAANRQGTYRLDRGINFERYDRHVLRPASPHSLQVVAGCRHDVRCVFPSTEGRWALFSG